MEESKLFVKVIEPLPKNKEADVQKYKLVIYYKGTKLVSLIKMGYNNIYIKEEDVPLGLKHATALGKYPTDLSNLEIHQSGAKERTKILTILEPEGNVILTIVINEDFNKITMSNYHKRSRFRDYVRIDLPEDLKEAR